MLLIAALPGCRREVNFNDIGNPSTRPTATPKPAALTATAKAAPSNTPTIVIDTSTPTPTRAAPETTAIYYTTRAGDTLSGIAMAFGTTVESLMRINGMANADQLAAGQQLQISLDAQHTGPGTLLIPDNELVYGPEYKNFDIAQATAALPGIFKNYSEDVLGVDMTANEIVRLIAEQYSVGPRVLLALLELRGGWLSNPEPAAEQYAYPLGYTTLPHMNGLYRQLSLAADALNIGLYGWWMDTLWLVQTRDGAYIQFSTQINGGTAGVQRALAPSAASYDSWLADLTRFATIYRNLFGAPLAAPIEPLLPAGLEAPKLILPWPKDATWYYTGGPHPGYGTQGPFAALDFTTNERNIGCTPSNQWATAAADGLVVHSHDGMVIQDLDGDGFIGTGWVMYYLHLASNERVQNGTMLKAGDNLGHPSCEGGVSNATHLHIARRYNGVWVAADDPRWPMTLSGWIPASAGDAYYGTLSRGGQTRTACECWEQINAVSH
ncbi:MAG: LysM peptidoglycan-binding domain-containing protein [Thermoflexales bacterium]|nr:LysM peptidoglycan-binding domain-containing protein [Thermoflexales bacterium]